MENLSSGISKASEGVCRVPAGIREGAEIQQEVVCPDPLNQLFLQKDLWASTKCQALPDTKVEWERTGPSLPRGAASLMGETDKVEREMC